MRCMLAARQAPPRPLLTLDNGATDGARSLNGLIMGCYVHGLFNRGSARETFLGEMGAVTDGREQTVRVHSALDEIACALEDAFDTQALARIAGLRSVEPRSGRPRPQS